MSQPPPSFGPPPGYGNPPPPTQPYGTMPVQPPRTSIAAVFSLICGLLGCFVVTGIIAVITGIIGLSATKNPHVKGRGLAIAGIVTGLLFGLGGAACFGTSALVWVKGKDAIVASMTATNFIEASSRGDKKTATNLVDTTQLSQSEIDGFVATLRLLGPPKSVDPDGMPTVTTVNGRKTVNVGVTLRYPSTSTHLSLDVTQQSDGSYKISGLHEK